MERLTGEFSPAKENATTGYVRGGSDLAVEGASSVKASPSSAIPNTRNSPLSWQRRPNSQASDRPRSRPLSMVATENAACSPRATPEPSTASDEQSSTSRDQISQLLGSKDPTWFRQTADRGEGSPAYRRIQVEDDDVYSSRVQLPGMADELPKQSEKTKNTLSDIGHSSLQMGTIPNNTSIGKTSYANISMTSRTIGSLPLTNTIRLDPPKSDTTSHKSDDTSEIVRGMAMSPSQGRISPERLERPVSPTKGMGGFVQSAMMKRSDSVSKRWSVQSPQGLSRGNSVASNRSNHDSVVNIASQGRESQPCSLSRDNSPLPLSRPTSSHSSVTVMQESERPSTSSSLRSSMTTLTTNDTFIKPALPALRPHTSVNVKEDGGENSKDPSPNTETTPPSSPSKTTDNRRWSPTKSSWLESALNKPDSPKPKISLPPQQPSWMSEINKVKQQKANIESARSSPVHKHEVNIGGLLRSPPLGGPLNPLGISGLPITPSSGNVMRSRMENGNIHETTGKASSPTSPPEVLRRLPIGKSDSSGSATPTTPTGSLGSNSASSLPIGAKVKPEAPPKIDFRSNLRPRQIPSENESKQEPEFKNVFGQLRRTKTQNYVAPDELKDNILRGKAALNMTGGPKKTERKDEFKEAILKKKEDFRKAQLEGTGVTRPTSSTTQNTVPVPEALAKKAKLGKNPTSVVPREPSRPKGLVPSSTDGTPGHQIAADLLKRTSSNEPAVTGHLPGRESGSKLADRFNPALANLLARGPPLATSDPARSPSPALSQPRNITGENDSQESGPQLIHMTKGRARGPRRKAPTTLITHSQNQSAAEAKGQDQIPAISSYFTEQPDSGSLGSGGDCEKTFPKSSSEAENGSIQISSQGKIDPNRRPMFLENVPNKNEKTIRQLESPTPLLPTKKANSSELLMRKPETDATIPVLKVVPTMEPKPPSLNVIQRLELPNPLDPRHTLSSPSMSKNYPEPTKGTMSDSVSGVELPTERSETDVSTAVLNSVVLPSRKATLEPSEKRTVAKEPIKLPTQNDGDAMQASSGLRSPGTRGRAETGGTSVLAAGNGTAPNLKSRLPAAATLVSTRPLPALPIPTVSIPTSSTPSILPKKSAFQSVPQSSEASRLVRDFFGKNDFVRDFDVDTSSILSAKAEETVKIKTLRSQLFQITGDGKKQQVPSHQERLLFQSNMYVCPHTFGTLEGKKTVEVYFWAGDDVPESSIDDAEIFAQREARSAGGKLVKMRQGRETPQFIEALGGIMITRRGSSNKYDSLAPHILCGRRYAGQIAFDEVDFSPLSLCSGFPYLITTQSGKCYLWKGKGSSIDELSCARLIGMDFGITGEVEEIEDGYEPDSFLKIFGDEATILKSADHWRLKPNYQKYSARLFRVDTSIKSKACQPSLTLQYRANIL
jgi:Domain of unknown function (DUF4045)